MTVLFGLVTAFAWAFANVFTQQVTRTKTKPAVIMFWILTVTTAAVLPLALKKLGESWLRLSEQFPAKDKWCSAEFHL